MLDLISISISYDEDTISNFEDGIDKLDFSSYTKDDGAGGTVTITFADLTLTQSGSNVTVTSLEFDSGDQITINNILVANVTVDDLLFG